MKKNTYKINQLFFITHINNLKSIVENGILSHNLVKRRSIPNDTISNQEIVNNRQSRRTPADKSLWDYANLYFQPRNPMMYRVIKQIDQRIDKNDIAIIGIKPEVLNLPGVFISIGNAASLLSEIVDVQTGKEYIEKKLWSTIQSLWWKEEDGTKRQIMAECLVPDFVPPNLIQAIYVAKDETQKTVQSLLGPNHGQIPIITEANFFFQPNRKYVIAQNLSLIDGDLFFSQMQTLTISVNTKGVMGKGLASRAKYQFPDVYVKYQDLCRNKILQMGKPYLYKRETSVDKELSEETGQSEVLNSNKWFLLFPTKTDWRLDSDFHGIREGLLWFKSIYKKENVKSIAIPALGCGLGKLDWKDVGPMMCTLLSDLDIPIAIYLPQEHTIQDTFLTKKYLLGE